jgi:hypothetical protein
MANTYPVTVIKPFDQREIDAIAAPFVDLGNTIKGQKEALTAKQKAIRNREATMYESAYAKLDSIEDVDYSTYDENMRDFFDGKVDDYVTIANGIDAGTINPKEGARSLSYISNMVDEYKTLAPKVLAQAKYMMEHGAGGDNTLSKLNDPNLEIMFSKLLEGSGEVTLAENEKGKMYLKGEGTLDGEDWSYNLNLSEFDKLDAKGDSLAITTISNDDLGLLTVGETAAATSVTEQAKNTGITTEYTNVDTMRNNLNGSFSNSVDKLIANPDFNAYWADKIYKQHDVDYLMDNNMLWDAADEDKRKIAKDYLIKEMINQIPKEQQIQFKVINEDGTFDPSSGVEGVEGSTWDINALVATETGDTEARDTATIYVDDPVGSMQATEKSGDYLKVTEKGSIITVSFGDETELDADGKPVSPEIIKYDLDKQKDFIAYHQKIRERNKRFEGTAQDSQKRKEQFPQILKMEFLKRQKQKRAIAARTSITDNYTREDFKSRNDTSGMSDDEIFTAYREEVEKRVRELEEAVNHKIK